MDCGTRKERGRRAGRIVEQHDFVANRVLRDEVGNIVKRPVRSKMTTPS
jgi:hypothetical protein